ERQEEVRRQDGAALFEQPGEEQIEGPQAASLQLLGQRLDADADRRRQLTVAQSRGHFAGGDLREAVLFLIGPVAEAVLEIDAEVFDRLARELVDEPPVDAVGERRAEAG